jgi:hypothetical protein
LVIFLVPSNQLTSLEGCSSSVGGGFYCDNNQLTSLEGAPSSVGTGFYCNNNELTSLKGAPSSVSGNFSCNNNYLTSLKSAPSSVSGDFSCHNNRLTSLEGCPSSVSGHFYCSNNRLTSLKGAPVNCMSRGDFYNIFNDGDFGDFDFSWNQEELDKYWVEQIENDILVFKNLEINNKKRAYKSNQISKELYDKYAYLNRVNKAGLFDMRDEIHQII